MKQETKVPPKVAIDPKVKGKLADALTKPPKKGLNKSTKGREWFRHYGA